MSEKTLTNSERQPGFCRWVEDMMFRATVRLVIRWLERYAESLPEEAADPSELETASYDQDTLREAADILRAGVGR